MPQKVLEAPLQNLPRHHSHLVLSGVLKLPFHWGVHLCSVLWWDIYWAFTFFFLFSPGCFLLTGWPRLLDLRGEFVLFHELHNRCIGQVLSHNKQHTSIVFAYRSVGQWRWLCFRLWVTVGLLPLVPEALGSMPFLWQMTEAWKAKLDEASAFKVTAHFTFYWAKQVTWLSPSWVGWRCTFCLSQWWGSAESHGKGCGCRCCGGGNEEVERVIQSHIVPGSMLWVASGQSGRAKHLTSKKINPPLVLSYLSVDCQSVPFVGRLSIKVATSFGIMQPLVWVLGLASGRQSGIQPPPAPGWASSCRVKLQVWMLWPCAHPRSDSQGPGMHFVTTDSK